MTPGRQMLEAVRRLTCERDVSPGEFLDGAFAILTAALGKLPEAQREASLASIERGNLREAVDTFVARCSALEQAKRRRLQ
jgi:hypothetical protein